MNHEQALIGAILSGAADVADLTLVGADFDDPHHEVIYDACRRIDATGGKPTTLAVHAALGAEANRLPGGPTYLHTLMQSWGADDPEWLAEQIAAQAARRRLDSAALQIHQLASDTNASAGEISEQARQAIDNATRAEQITGGRLIGEVLLDVMEAAENGRTAALSTPWPDLDRHIHGLMPGRLYVIGARPGVGKSIVAAQIVAHVAKRHGLAAHMATLEMSETEVTQRILAAEAGVELDRLEFGHGLNDLDWRNIAAVQPAMSEWPLRIDDNPRQSLATIRAAVRSRQRREHVGVVVIDYLGLVEPADRRVPRHEQIGAITAGLKIMARELDVPVVLCAQLNRASLSRSDSRPTLGDLRESGAIEQDADAVILMHRPNLDAPDVQVIVAKIRNGPVGEFELLLQGHFARLVSSAVTYVPERSTS